MKKAIAIVIVAVMLCVVFTADSADADFTYLYINGHSVTGDETNNEEGWSFAVSGRTLTLNNATLDDGLHIDDVTHLDSTIFYPLTSTLNIVLIGDSTISVLDGPGWLSAAIESEGSVAISGDGTLTITNPIADGWGIYSSRGDITINGGDITIDASVAILSENVWGDSDKGNVNITGGIIHTNGRISGGDYSCFDMTGGYLIVSGLAADGVAVSIEDSINLHGAGTSNATVTANQITATAAGDVIFSHWYNKTVIFDVNGGQCLVTSAVTGIDGKLDSLPTATRDGYVFIGWFTSPSGGVQVLPDNVYDSDRTIYANWTSDSGPSPDERPSPDSPDSGDDKKANNGLLIGGIVGGIAAVAVIAGVVIFFIRKH